MLYPFDRHMSESKEVNLFLSTITSYNYSKTVCGRICLHESTVLWRRPDWGGIILEIMKNNKHVVLREIYMK